MKKKHMKVRSPFKLLELHWLTGHCKRPFSVQILDSVLIYALLRVPMVVDVRKSISNFEFVWIETHSYVESFKYQPSYAVM